MSTVRSIERRLYSRRQDDREIRSHLAARQELAPASGWSGVWHGYMAMVGVAALLLSLVFGIGFSSLDPVNAASWTHMGRGVGIWSIIAVLIALFVGCWVAGRATPLAPRSTGIGRGITLWGLALATLIVATLWIASTTAMAASQAAGAAMSAAASAAPSAANGGTAAAAGSSVSWGMFWFTLIGLGCAILGGAAGAAGGRAPRAETPVASNR